MSESGQRRGLGRDLQRARQGTAATAAELREFVAQFRGRRPEEVMGLITSNSLVRSTTLAAIATVVFIGIFTVMPFAWNKLSPKAAKAAPAAAAPTPSAEQTPTAQQPAPAASAAAPTADAAPVATSAPSVPGVTAEPSDANKRDALKALDLDATKSADPTVNPLENSSDDLLKDLK